MKKMMLVAIGMMFAVAGFSQFSVGVQAIGNLGNASVKNIADVSFTKKMKLAPGGGVVLQYDISDRLSIRSGVNYLQQGVTLKAKLDPAANVKATAENKLHYLQVPVNVLYNFPVGNFKLYAGAGGYVNYGISGESKQTTILKTPEGDEEVSIEKLKAFKKESDGGAGLKKIDYGASALAGIKFNNGLFANVGYQLSLRNISEGDGKYKNRGLQLSVGYFF